MKPTKELITKMGLRLKGLREHYGYTQQQVADFLGIDQSNYSKIEHGQRRINKLSHLEDLCDLYSCTEHYLLCESDDYAPNRLRGTKGVDLNVIAQMNRTMNYLQMLRACERREPIIKKRGIR